MCKLLEAPRPELHRTGPWIQTYSGGRFWPFDPRPEDVFIGEIAHALSNKCRYSGHCDQFYSVAQHCVIMSQAVEMSYGNSYLALWALLHDAAEAYLSDIPRPLKPHYRIEVAGRLWSFDEIELRLMTAIAAQFGITMPEPPEITQADLRMLATEKRDLMEASERWTMLDNVVPYAPRIVPCTPAEANDAFIALYERLRADNHRRPDAV
jgi:hypothetical protein